MQCQHSAKSESAMRIYTLSLLTYPEDRGKGRGTSSLDCSTTWGLQTLGQRHCQSPTLSQTESQTRRPRRAYHTATADTNTHTHSCVLDLQWQCANRCRHTDTRNSPITSTYRWQQQSWAV